MNNPKSRNHELVVQEFANEVLIYDLNNNTAYSLNETSASVWRMCDGKTSVGQMGGQLAEQLNQPVSEDVIWLALDNLKRNNLLANDENFKIEFNGLSRREVIKKVGLASMIALPIISSIVTPIAAHAASPFLGLNAACTSSSQCLSGRTCQSGTAQAGPRCCAPGQINNGAPNQVIGCDPGCTQVNSCCSGSARVGPPIQFCTNLGFTTCYCN